MTTTQATTTQATIIDSYLAAYGEPDDVARAGLISQAFAADATLTDPPFTATGHAALSGSFAAVQAQFPEHRFARTSALDSHHDMARYSWALNGPDGSTAVAGLDFVRFDADGMILSVTGFFGDVDPSSERGSGHE